MVFSIFTKLGNITTNFRTFSSLQKETHTHERSRIAPHPPSPNPPATVLTLCPSGFACLDPGHSRVHSPRRSSPRPALLPSAQILKHLQEQKDSQCLHVEEYQNLVKDLRMELESVSEQKKNIMKGKPWASGGGGWGQPRKAERPPEQETLCLLPL